MDDWNIRNMERMCSGDPEGKIHKLMEYDGKSADVADPWYTDDFETAWRDIYAGCSGLLTYLTEGK